MNLVWHTIWPTPIIIIAAVGPLHAAGARTPNFSVEAPTSQLAQQVGQYAEYYRREKAVLWVGSELPGWSQPCPVQVTVTSGSSGGATSFGYSAGTVTVQSMHIEGTVERLLTSVLPHEVTHTVLASYYRRPLLRWADEGIAVMSEEPTERLRQDTACRAILNGGRAIPLRRLFGMTEYPADVGALYAEGYCVTNWLVGRGGRRALVAALAVAGDQSGDALARAYGYDSVDLLERAWLDDMRTTRGAPVLAGEGRPASTPPPTMTSLPPSGTGVSAGASEDRVLAVLTRVESALGRVEALSRDVAGLQDRVSVLEKAERERRAAAPAPSPATAWADPPARTQPVVRSIPLATPAPYVPVYTVPGLGGPVCPTGQCPIQQGRQQ